MPTPTTSFPRPLIPSACLQKVFLLRTTISDKFLPAVEGVQSIFAPCSGSETNGVRHDYREIKEFVSPFISHSMRGESTIVKGPYAIFSGSFLAHLPESVAK
jgi:hypothetical protein